MNANEIAKKWLTDYDPKTDPAPPPALLGELARQWATLSGLK